MDEFGIHHPQDSLELASSWVMDPGPKDIGRYKVLGELGQGAMGVVYLAEDPRLKRKVAIKVVRGGIQAQEEALERFQREAEISAKLSHPNVITVFDVGEEAGLGPFMAMEFVDGPVLSELLTQGTLSTEQALMFLIQALLALEAAHAQGIIHRDFKLENLMITKDGRLKLMDFGIARRQDPGLSTSGVLCTPTYTAPEIVAGQAPSDATDRWAYHVSAFRMLLGRSPFEAESISALLYSIVHDPPRFPESMEPALKAVFLKALHKDPEVRYPDLRSFLQELMDALPLSEEVRIRSAALMEIPIPAGLGATQRLSKSGTSLWRRLRWFHWTSAVAAMGILGVLWLWRTGTLFPRRLSVTSEPSGAKVFLDDVVQGTTPLREIPVPPKARLLRLEKPGYRVVEHALIADERMLTLKLEILPLRFNLKTDPGGAEVLVDGVSKGVTPIQGLETPSQGRHYLQIRKAGYESVSMTIGRDHAPPESIRLRKLDAKPAKKSFWKRLFGN